MIRSEKQFVQFWDRLLVLSGEEGAKLTLLLNNSEDYGTLINESTFYGDDVETLINLPGSTSKVINIDAETDGAVSAMMRVALGERSNIWDESFEVFVNGNAITVDATGSNGFDDGDRWLFTREIDVPLEYLIDGNNEVYVDFDSNGGKLVTTSLIISTDLTPNMVGDFDGDGDIDGDDLDQYGGNLGEPPVGDLADLDLNSDGKIDGIDLATHFATLVATSNGGTGTFAGDANLDGIVDVLGDAAILINNLGITGATWSQGDFNGDGTIDVLGDAAALVNNLGNSNGGSNSTVSSAVPEPNSLSLLFLAGLGPLIRRVRF